MGYTAKCVHGVSSDGVSFSMGRTKLLCGRACLEFPRKQACVERCAFNASHDGVKAACESHGGIGEWNNHPCGG